MTRIWVTWHVWITCPGHTEIYSLVNVNNLIKRVFFRTWPSWRLTELEYSVTVHKHMHDSELSHILTSLFILLSVSAWKPKLLIFIFIFQQVTIPFDGSTLKAHGRFNSKNLHSIFLNDHDSLTKIYTGVQVLHTRLHGSKSNYFRVKFRFTSV